MKYVHICVILAATKIKKDLRLFHENIVEKKRVCVCVYPSKFFNDLIFHPSV